MLHFLLLEVKWKDTYGTKSSKEIDLLYLMKNLVMPSGGQNKLIWLLVVVVEEELKEMVLLHLMKKFNSKKEKRF